MANMDVTSPDAAQLLHDRLIEAHKAFYTDDPHGQLSPLVFAYTPDGHGMGITFDMGGSPADKDAMAAELKSLFDEKGVVMYAFFAEAWMAGYDKRPDGSVPSPSQREDRKEVVVTFVVRRDGGKVCSLMEINRDWETGGAVLSVADRSADNFGGRFAELFD